MKVNGLLLGTLLLVTCEAPTFAGANGPELYDPPPVLKANPLTEGTLAIDVMGIVPGMTPEQVEPLVRKAFGDMWFVKLKNAFNASRQSVWVRSTDYVYRVSGTKYGQGSEFQDHIDVNMSGVAGGNQSIGLSRSTCYGDGIERPFLVDVIKSLTDKYGAPSLAAVGRMDWAYRDGVRVDIPAGTRLLSGFNQYDVGMLALYPDADEPTDYRIQARFDLDSRDNTRIKCLEIDAGSNRLRREAARADLRILNERLDRAVATHPHVAGPDL